MAEKDNQPKADLDDSFELASWVNQRKISENCDNCVDLMAIVESLLNTVGTQAGVSQIFYFLIARNIK